MYVIKDQRGVHKIKSNHIKGERVFLQIPRDRIKIEALKYIVPIPSTSESHDRWEIVKKRILIYNDPGNDE